MADFWTKAVTNFGTNGLYKDAVIPNTVSGGALVKSSNSDLYRSRESASVKAQLEVVSQQQPSTSVPANIVVSGGSFDFRIEPSIDIVEKMYLIIQIYNGDSSAVVIQPSQLLIDRYEVYADNGNRLLTQVYNTENWNNNAFLSFSSWNVLAPFFGSDSSYSTAGVSIAATSYKTLYLPLYSFFVPLKLALGGLKSTLLLRFYFGNNNVISGNSASLILSNTYLQLRGLMLPQAAKLERNKSYMTIPQSLPYIGYQRQTVSQTFQSSSTYDFVLSGIRGLASYMWFVVRALPLSASNEASYIKMDSFDVTTQDGASILGYYRRLYSDMQVSFAENHDSMFINYVNAHFIAFSSDYQRDFIDGSVSGCYPFTSYERLSITTPSTLSAGAYRLDIYIGSREYALIQNGDISTTRSN